jgi:intracellular multiplication protein IcmV
MGFFRFVGKTVADVPSWVGVNQIKQQTKFLIQNIKPIFKVKKVTTPRTFEQAMSTFNIKEEELPNIIRTFTCHFIIYLITAFSFSTYAFYLFLHKYLMVGIIVILIATVFLLKAFSAHFLCFQIKHRKLGCSLQEWFNGQIKDNSQ